MSYKDVLASRGYQRVTVQRTDKLPGHLVLHRVDQAAERVPGKSRVVQMRGRG